MQAVIVCVSYSDFLAHTLPINLPQFDSMVVVTEDWDVNTIDLCKFYDVQYRTVPGNKGTKINAGLRELLDKNKTGYVVQMDADIWLPPQTVRILRRTNLDKETIYGIDRAMCRSYKDFVEMLGGTKKAYPEKYFTVPPFPLGARVVQHYGIGYIPIGYFQLWHPLGSGIFSYPEEHHEEGSYARTDILHAQRFQRRALIPEVLSVHLEEGDPPMGANWNGRTTPQFGPHKFTPSPDLSYKN